MQIVRNHKLSIPSRSKYQIDKIGVNEALLVPEADLKKDVHLMGRVTAAAYQHARIRGKKFHVFYSAKQKALVVSRVADPSGDGEGEGTTGSKTKG